MLIAKNYQLIQQAIDYSIRTSSPICLRYESQYSRKIRDVCSKEDTKTILKNIKVYS